MNDISPLDITEDTNNMRFSASEENNIQCNTSIKVIGIGGGGGNAVAYMAKSEIEVVEMIALNTDVQAFNGLPNSVKKIQIGSVLTKGFGAGSNPDIGRNAALEDKKKIENLLKDCDMIFITAGMGGGTGTGAAPVVAQIAKEQNILTVGVVTKPFLFEGGKRNQVAAAGITQLLEYIDTLIIIPNDKLGINTTDITLIEAFDRANDVLKNAVRDISSLITAPGLIKLDFADVKSSLANAGVSIIGSGESSSQSNAAHEAMKIAIENPLLSDIDISESKGVLLNLTGSSNLKLDDCTTVLRAVEEFASKDKDSSRIIGMSIDESLGETLRVTVIATGVDQSISHQVIPPKAVSATNKDSGTSTPIPATATIHNNTPIPVDTDNTSTSDNDVPAHIDILKLIQRKNNHKE